MEFGALAPLLIANLALFAPVAALVARRRQRSTAAWFAFGIVLGPLALAVAWAAPPGRCPACDSAPVGWLRECAACGADVRSGSLPDHVAAAAEPSKYARASRRRTTPAAPAMPATPATPRSSARPRSNRPSPTETGRRRRDMARPIAVGPGRPVAPEPDAPIAIADGASGAPLGTAPPPAALSGSSGIEALATGVYAGGSVGLEIGHRYTISRDETDLIILGPVETSPTVIAHVRELVNIDPVGVDDRLVVTGVGGDRGKYLLRFQAVAGMSPERVEHRLAETQPQPVGSTVGIGTPGD